MVKRAVIARYTRCKTSGHWWDEYDPPQGEWDGITVWDVTKVIEHKRCVGECGSTRMFQLDGNGDVIARAYHRPDDYKWTGPDDEKPTRGEMRLARLKR